MKSILFFSSYALLSCCQILPVSALDSVVDQSILTSQPREVQQVAGGFEILTSTIKVTTDAMEMIHQQKQRNHTLRVQEAQEQERQERLAVEQRLREQEYEYKTALARLQFREAERRREEYLRLTEAEQAVYLAEQRSKPEMEAILFLGLIGGLVEVDLLGAVTDEVPSASTANAETSETARLSLGE